jgi:hypothetical protein
VKGSCRGTRDVIDDDGNIVGSQPSLLGSGSASPLGRSVSERVDLSNDPEAYARYKPFWCQLCSKRYKNVNGLKYHGKVEHASFDFELEVKGQELGL